MGKVTPIYLGWEAKVDQIFNVYEVQEDQKVKLASLEFLDYDMQWWHQVVMEIGLNKRPTVVSWYDFARGLFPLIIGRNSYGSSNDFNKDLEV